MTCHKALPVLRQRRIYSTHPALYFTCRLVVWVLTVHCALELSRALSKEDRCFQQHSHLLVTRGHFHLQSAVSIVLFTPAALYNAHLPCAASDNCSLCPDIDGRTYTRSNRSQLQTTPASAEYTKVHMYKASHQITVRQNIPYLLIWIWE